MRPGCGLTIVPRIREREPSHAMGINEFPKTVACVGGTLCDTDKGHGEPRDVADTTMMMAGFPCGVQIFLAGSTVNERGIEDVIRGQKANMLLGGLKVEIRPERPFAEEIEAKDETPADSGETHAKHRRISLIRSETTFRRTAA